MTDLNACRTIFHVGDAGVKVCNFCGSLSVTDAIMYLKLPGTKFSGSDWKYGWPHKFYIEPKNPDASKIVEVGSESGPDVDGKLAGDYWTCFAHGREVCSCPKENHSTGYWVRPIMGNKESLYFKFYNNHLKDATDEEFKEFSDLSARLFNILWAKDQVGIKYVAPSTTCIYGYQRAGVVLKDGSPSYTL